MNLSAASPSARPNDVQRLGTLSSKWHLDEPIFAGRAVGSFSTLDEAMGGTAALAEQDPGTYAILRGQGSFDAHLVEQPLWTRHFGSYQSSRTTPTELVPRDGADATRPEFEFASFRTGSGGLDVADRIGRIKLDARAGVEALIGASAHDGPWAFVNGRMAPVTATPQKPAPTEPSEPTEPTPPPTPPDSTLVTDVTEAVRLVTESARIIQTVPLDDRGAEETKATRIKAYRTNLEAQASLERQFDAGNPSSVLSQLRTADAYLEDANWQLAKKPSPDGRFNGVDVPGALRDTQKAVDLLTSVLRGATESAASAA